MRPNILAYQGPSTPRAYEVRYALALWRKAFLTFFFAALQLAVGVALFGILGWRFAVFAHDVLQGGAGLRVPSILAWLAFMTAPALMASAGVRLRAQARLPRVDIARCVELLRTLDHVAVGIPTRDLLKPGESAPEQRRVLEYLKFYDWVDTSKAGDRVWILTTARRRLGAVEAAP